jgi:hypothetical protein
VVRSHLLFPCFLTRVHPEQLFRSRPLSCLP